MLKQDFVIDLLLEKADHSQPERYIPLQSAFTSSNASQGKRESEPSHKHTTRGGNTHRMQSKLEKSNDNDPHVPARLLERALTLILQEN